MNKTLEEIQKVKSVSSIKIFEEQEVKRVRDIEEEEEILEKEIALIKKKLDKEERKEANRDLSMRPPPQKNISCHFKSLYNCFRPYRLRGGNPRDPRQTK